MNLPRLKFTPALLLTAAVSFLVLRNLPLCLLMPLWTFGDEMPHLDYAVKLSRGHIPQPLDMIEPEVFALHRDHADDRYVSASPQPPVHEVQDLGFASLSYESHQPPLPYLFYAGFHKAFSLLRIPLHVQVKLLRLAALLAVLSGLVIIHRKLRQVPDAGLLFYLPILLVALLAQDTYFSVNTDAFSFLFGALAAGQMLFLIGQSASLRRWAALSLFVALLMWVKVSNAYYFAFWALLTYFLWEKTRSKRTVLISFLFLALALALSSPWYIYNQFRFSSPFHFHYAQMAGKPHFPAAGVSFDSLKIFWLAFTRTLFRGEFVWNGTYLDILPRLLKNIWLSAIPLLAFAGGLLSFKKSLDRSPRRMSQFLLAGSALLFASLAAGYLIPGGLPFYQARLSFGALYLWMFVLSWGWARLTGGESSACLAAGFWLLSFNLVQTAGMVVRVLGHR